MKIKCYKYEFVGGAVPQFHRLNFTTKMSKVLFAICAAAILAVAVTGVQRVSLGVGDFEFKRLIPANVLRGKNQLRNSDHLRGRPFSAHVLERGGSQMCAQIALPSE